MWTWTIKILWIPQKTMRVIVTKKTFFGKRACLGILPYWFWIYSNGGCNDMILNYRTWVLSWVRRNLSVVVSKQHYCNSKSIRQYSQTRTITDRFVITMRRIISADIHLCTMVWVLMADKQFGFHSLRRGFYLVDSLARYSGTDRHKRSVLEQKTPNFLSARKTYTDPISNINRNKKYQSRLQNYKIGILK